MRRIFVLFTALMTIIFVPKQAYTEGNCKVLQVKDPKDNVLVALEDIRQSGVYCLGQDIKAPRVGGLFGERNSPYHQALSIKASNVVFDLQGFTINIEASGMVGISSGYWSDLFSQQRITVRSGTIKTKTQSAIKFGIPDGSLLSDFQAIYKSPQTKGFAEGELQKLLKALPQSANYYQKTEHLIEKIKIESDSDPGATSI